MLAIFMFLVALIVTLYAFGGTFITYIAARQMGLVRAEAIKAFITMPAAIAMVLWLIWIAVYFWPG
jgi:hypothetical protein